MRVPPLDLPRQYQIFKPQLLKAFEALLESGQYILGKDVEALEKETAAYLGVKHALAVSSGTSALWLAIRALDIRPGELVVTTPFTFFATISAIMNTGARPLFVDIDSETLNIDPNQIEAILKKDTQKKIRAILPVHMYGNPADMDAIISVAEKYHLPVIEDAAQAIGSKIREKCVGGLGDVGCFSFFPTKNLGALGDAGLVVTQREDLAQKLKMLRVHGQKQRYYHSMIGDNCRMDTVQAACLRVFLPHLEEWLNRRREIAAFYDKRILELKDNFMLPKTLAHHRHTYHQYTVIVKNGRRDPLQKFLDENGVSSSIYYPVPCHKQQALCDLGCDSVQLPNAERISASVLSLPIHPMMTDEQAEYVVSLLLKDSSSR